MSKLKVENLKTNSKDSQDSRYSRYSGYSAYSGYSESSESSEYAIFGAQLKNKQATIVDMYPLFIRNPKGSLETYTENDTFKVRYIDLILHAKIPKSEASGFKIFQQDIIKLLDHHTCEILVDIFNDETLYYRGSSRNITPRSLAMSSLLLNHMFIVYDYIITRCPLLYVNPLEDLDIIMGQLFMINNLSILSDRTILTHMKKISGMLLKTLKKNERYSKDWFRVLYNTLNDKITQLTRTKYYMTHGKLSISNILYGDNPYLMELSAILNTNIDWENNADYLSHGELERQMSLDDILFKFDYVLKVFNPKSRIATMDIFQPLMAQRR